MDRFYQKIGYCFKDQAVLLEALTHSSYGHEQHCSYNERLEFLGDSILGFVVAKELFTRYPKAQEGDLSKQKSVIVSSPSLAKKAREMDLGGFLRVGEGERRSGGNDKDSILADAVESIIAAIYLDGGLAPAEFFILSLFEEELNESGLTLKENEDFKTRLQEKVQACGFECPRYEILAERGPSHNREFDAQVFVADRPGPIGTGKSKKAAQQEAAKNLLENELLFDELAKESH